MIELQLAIDHRDALVNGMMIHLHALLDPEGDQELSSLPPARRWLTVLLRILVLFGILGVCFIIVALSELVVVALVFPGSNPPASMDKPPILSNARNVQVTPTDNLGGKRITYETTTDPAEIYAFYDAALVKDGWGREASVSDPHLATTGISFEWERRDYINGCEGLAYSLQVTAAKTSPLTTSVQLAVAQANPC